ncbi:glycosyltransferase [Methylobacterium tardum]|uniref:glycosyltransferase n=1 Tax=Methylobacterium tardum TaxID=374432 RepID=UPI003608FC45
MRETDGGRQSAGPASHEELVDSDWYLATNGDVAEAGLDPADHYVRYGRAEGRFPNPAAAARHAREAGLVQMTRVDPVWYRTAYPDVAAAGVDPAEHYALSGHTEGRHPNAAAAARYAREAGRELMAQVDPAWYLAAYPDVAAAGVDPAEHYALSGHTEGRHPNAAAAARYAREAGRELMAQVDPAWYLAAYPDVAAAGVDPAEHYALSGHTEGRHPNAEAATKQARRSEVDLDWYVARYPDVSNSGLDPAEHYAVRGHAEGRLPNSAHLPVEAWAPAEEQAPTATPLAQYPLVAVVTPVRNRRAWSVDFARMLDGQDYPLFRFYAVDSNSTDGTPQALRDLDVAGCTVLSAPDSAFWTAATNIGVARALADGCDYILTINDDAIIPADFLTAIVGAAERAGARIVGSVIAFANQPGRLWGVGAYNDWNSGSFVQLTMAGTEDEVLAQAPRSSSGLIAADYLCGNGTLIHRSVFEDIGLYDVRHLPHYHADSEFTMRAERAGIERWIAPDARLFNRFTVDGDGIFAPRNQRLFSFRSANYARPLVYIIDTYCPGALKARALVRYFVKYVKDPSDRMWSRLLRIVRLIDTPAADRRVIRGDFFPPSDADLRAAEDLEILLSLSEPAFLALLYPILLRRLEFVAEHARQTEALRSGGDRRNIIREILARPEARYARHVRTAFLSAYLDGEEEPAAALSPGQRRLLVASIGTGRLPSRAEARALSQGTAGLDQDVPGAEALTVYMNVDVLCMAVTDPKAATGVHRYVHNVMQELARDARIDLRLFHAPQLEDSAAALRAGNFAQTTFAKPGLRPRSGVAFYPYFPFAGVDPRFEGLPQVFTVHDLFPLTNPNWFSKVAVSKFNAQLRYLADADHVLCVSAATEEALRATFPTLPATSSVAHHGVAQPSGSGRTAGSAHPVTADGAPYFICVGTIEPRKNLRTVIAAMRHLRAASVQDLRMVVVGQAGWSVTAEGLTDLAGADADRITFLGRVPDEQLWDLYAGAVCTVFPSLAEGFGLPIVESFACGTPVVTSDGSSMAEIARSGAILVDPTDPAAIAAAVERLATDATLRAALAREAELRSRQFSWEACAARHVEAFMRVAGLNTTLVPEKNLLTFGRGAAAAAARSEGILVQ